MSQKEAKDIIEGLINTVLESVSPRKSLDASVHILDLSYEHVMQSNKIKPSKNSMESYMSLLFAVESKARTADSIDEAIDKVLNNRGTQYIQNLNLLVCKNFSAARNFITEISKLIPEDPYFGTSYRERTLPELKSAYGIEEGDSLKPLEGKAFVLEHGKIGQVQEVIHNNKSKFLIVPVYSSLNSGFIALKSPEGVISVEPASSYIGSRISLDNGTIELVKTELGDLPLLQRTYLSKLDLGHLFKKKTLGGDTPLGIRLQDAFIYQGLSPKNKALIGKYIDRLDKAHGKVDYIFHNKAAEGSLTQVSKSVGFVVLTVQYYKENNRLAVIEGRIKREITKKFKEIADSIPGSNTIIEDTAEKYINIVKKALGIKPKVLKQHKPVSGNVGIQNDLNLKISTAKTSGPNKSKKPSKNITKPTKVVLSNSSRISLTSLQNLINRQLQDVISANMGDGDRRNILNYRTGRLAASAKVERMSESRAGMITAFYSYMKNPYATFSDGGRQQYPKTRDPKLLISKSIREIAATQVANQLRAVNV